MKKEFLFLWVFFLFISCGGTEENTVTDANGTESPEREVAEEDAVVEEDSTQLSYIPDNEDGLWQIDDYAEMFTGGKIYGSSDDIPEKEKGGVSHYYRTLDMKGGYAFVTGAYAGWSEYVLWRMKDGNDLLGTMSAGCGPACDYSFEFYIMNNGEKLGSGNQLLPRMEIEDYGAGLMPQILEKYEGIEYKEDYQFYYNFPQKGTAMEVDIIVGADEVRTPIIMLSWDKEKFSVSEKYTELNERAG